MSTPTVQELTDKFFAMVTHLRSYRINFTEGSYQQQATMQKIFNSNVWDSNAVTSMTKDNASNHKVLLDIDYEAFLVPSTTRGHYHLYLDVPGGIPHRKYMRLLKELAKAGVIEKGYAGASIERGHTALRLPWVKK